MHQNSPKKRPRAHKATLSTHLPITSYKANLMLFLCKIWILECVSFSLTQFDSQTRIFGRKVHLVTMKYFPYIDLAEQMAGQSSRTSRGLDSGRYIFGLYACAAWLKEITFPGFLAESLSTASLLWSGIR